MGPDSAAKPFGGRPGKAYAFRFARSEAASER